MQDTLEKLIEKAVTMIEEGQIENGLRSLEKITDFASAYPDVLYQIANIYETLGHLEKALDVLGSIKSSDPDLLLEISLLKADILIDQGELDEAFGLLTELKEKYPKHVRVLVQLAEIYLLEDLPEVAVKYLENALSIDPSLEEIKLELSRIYRELGYAEKAMNLLNESFFAENPDTMLEKAKILAEQGEFERALEHYRHALRHKETPDRLFGAGLCSYQLGLWDDAALFFYRILELDEDYVKAYPYLAEVYYRLGKKELAADVYREAIKRNGEETNWLLRLSDILMEIGEKGESEIYRNYAQSLLREDDEKI